MDNLEPRIAAFYRTRSNNCRARSYLRFDLPGPFTYLCSPQASGTSLLSKRLTGADFGRKIVSFVARVGGYFPNVIQTLPRISKSSVTVPETGGFELAISSSRQTTILSPEQGITATIGWEKDSRIANEIDTRRRIPESINVPAILDVNRAFPYYVTEYICGRMITNPVTDWEYVLNALVQLRPWYESNDITWVSTDKAIAELREELGEKVEYPVIEKGLKRLVSMELPDQLARGQTHGDFHGQNLLVSDGTVYILDWERSRHEFLIRDFGTPFLRWLQYGGDKFLFSKLFHNKKEGAEISSTAAQKVGPIMWGTKEWFPSLVLYILLQEMARKSESKTKWQYAYRQCKLLLE